MKRAARSLVLWSVLVALGTLHPFVLEWREVVVPSDSFFVPRLKGFDPPFNVLMFLPLGALLRRLGVRTWAATLIGFGASAAIELAQHYVAFRVPVAEDLFFNTLGAFLGARFVGPLSRVAAVLDSRSSGPVAVRIVMFLATTAVVVWSAAPPIVEGTLWAWADHAELVVGREQPGNYVFGGEVHAARLFVGAQEPDALREPAWSLSRDGERSDASLARRIEAADAFTIDVDVSPGPVDETLRRIFTYSAGVQRRNFLLGAREDELVFRVRTRVTPIIGLFSNGEEPLTLPRPSRRARITIAYEPNVVRAWIDGALVATKTFVLPPHNGVRCFWLPRSVLGVWLYFFAAGLVVAAGAAGWTRWGFVVAMAVGIALELMQLSMYERGFQPIVVVPLLFGAALGAWSAARPEREDQNWSSPSPTTIS